MRFELLASSLLVAELSFHNRCTPPVVTLSSAKYKAVELPSLWAANTVTADPTIRPKAFVAGEVVAGNRGSERAYTNGLHRTSASRAMGAYKDPAGYT